MPRKPIVEHVSIISADKKTEGGSVYTLELVNNICNFINSRAGSLIIEELNTVERKMKGIDPALPLLDEAWGIIKEARVENGELIIGFEYTKTKYGKKFRRIVSSIGMNGLSIFPVGYGNVGENGIVSDYTLLFVGVLPKEAHAQS